MTLLSVRGGDGDPAAAFNHYFKRARIEEEACASAARFQRGCVVVAPRSASLNAERAVSGFEAGAHVRVPRGAVDGAALESVPTITVPLLAPGAAVVGALRVAGAAGGERFDGEDALAVRTRGEALGALAAGGFGETEVLTAPECVAEAVAAKAGAQSAVVVCARRSPS